jgi:hypothetical protein
MLRAMSLPELVTSANEIVVGKVVSVSAAWDPSHRKILSTIGVQIEESWKGLASGSIAIVQPGGTVGEIEMTVHGMPRFAVGERALLFLQGHNHFQVVGMSQGKRPLSWDTDRKQWLVESPDVGDVVEADARGRLRPVGPSARVTLDDLHEQLRAMDRN